MNYIDFPYITDAGLSCGANIIDGPLDGVSIVSGHEVAETQTDPQLNAWYDSSGHEIGDKCEWNVENVNFSNGTFPVQSLYSDSNNTCAFSFAFVSPLESCTQQMTDVEN